MRLGDEDSGNFIDRTGSPGFSMGGGGGNMLGCLLPLVMSRFGIVGVVILLLGYCALTQLGGGGSLIPGGTGLAFHRARKEKEVWEAEERQALLQQEKANMAAELQAMEDQQVASASAEQHDDGE